MCFISRVLIVNHGANVFGVPAGLCWGMLVGLLRHPERWIMGTLTNLKHQETLTTDGKKAKHDNSSRCQHGEKEKMRSLH
jgi:hypothetical protein